MQRGDFEGAAASARALADRHPDDLRVLAHLARSLVMTGRTAEGVAAIERLAARIPDDAAALHFVGGLYSLADEPERAAPFFQRAAEAMPDHPRFTYDLAASQRMTGAIEEARHSIERAIRLDPTNTEALWVRSDLHQATPDANHIDDLERRLRTPLDPQREAFVRYALVRECEEAGEWARAFTHLERGAALQRQFRRYDVRRDVQVLDALRQTQTRTAVDAASPGCADARPIFIVGLPRTGTTLVERVLAGHPSVQPIGESSAFDRALIDLAHKSGLSHDELTLARSALGLPMAGLGEAYARQAAARAGGAARFTDKQPRNAVNVGLIRAALPNARIVLVDRDPMDACWAMYKTLFLGGVYPFSVDLGDLAEYYAAWRRLADHWLDAFGDSVVHVRYEALVSDLAGETRRLLAGCGLDWHDGCLVFHKSTRPSSTASAVQIRRPVYTTSVGLWRRYEAQLAPLAERLHRLGVRIA